MKPSLQRKLLIISIVGLAYWLFGNLYEAIVISPNWVVDSPTQMKRLHDFFIVTTPTIYFVPITQLATVMVWAIYFTNKSLMIRIDLRNAAIFALLATALNAFIVITIVMKLFAPDFEKFGAYLTTLTWRWNVLNFFRMVLVSVIIHFLFKAYLKLHVGESKSLTFQICPR